MATEDVRYYVYSRDDAFATFLPLLKDHLPFSNSMFYRLQAPFNDTHSLFAATFPPESSASSSKIWTILFSDRSQDAHCQIRLHSSVFGAAYPPPMEQTPVIRQHVSAALALIRDTQIPEAPNQPFSPRLSIGCVNHVFLDAMEELAAAKGWGIKYEMWRLWTLPLTSERCEAAQVQLPGKMRFGEITQAEIAEVIATSKVRRKAESLLRIPNVAIWDEGEDKTKVAAWAYVGLDAALATLFVKEEYRGLGLAKCVAMEVVRRFGRSEFKHKGYANETGWMHSEVTEGLTGSEAVMRALGAKQEWPTWNVYIDLESASAT